MLLRLESERDLDLDRDRRFAGDRDRDERVRLGIYPHHRKKMRRGVDGNFFSVAYRHVS
jgi:hypothetical protein